MSAWKRISISARNGVVMVACFSLTVFSLWSAYRQRSHGFGNVAGYGIFALFWLYATIVLVLQAVTSRRYRRAIEELGMSPFNWKTVPIAAVVASEFGKGKKVFLSEGVRGDLNGTDVYTFNYTSDTAWWSKRRMVVVLARTSSSLPGEDVRQSLSKINAELTVHPDWLVVRSYDSVRPEALSRWLNTIVDKLKHR